MERKERRAEAEAMLRAARRALAEGGQVPDGILAADGFAFLVVGLELGVSILGRPIGTLELSMAEVRGKLQAIAGAPPYRTESASEAYTYPLLFCGPEGPVNEAYVFAGEDGVQLGGDEANRTDWDQVLAALESCLERARMVDYEDRVYDSYAGAWIYYGARRNEPFEETMEGEDPPEWAE